MKFYFNLGKKLLVVLRCFGLCDILLDFIGDIVIILTHTRLDIAGHNSHWVASGGVVRIVHLVLDVRDSLSQRWSAGWSWNWVLCLLLGAVFLRPV